MEDHCGAYKSIQTCSNLDGWVRVLEELSPVELGHLGVSNHRDPLSPDFENQGTRLQVYTSLTHVTLGYTGLQRI